MSEPPFSLGQAKADRGRIIGAPVSGYESPFRVISHLQRRFFGRWREDQRRIRDGRNDVARLAIRSDVELQKRPAFEAPVAGQLGVAAA